MTPRFRRTVRRLSALLLLGVAALRGGVPIVDAFSHHGTPERLGIHIDRPGGCSSHAEHCVLNRADSGARFIRAETVRHFTLARAIRAGRQWGSLSAGRQARSSNHSRAPPTTLV